MFTVFCSQIPVGKLRCDFLFCLRRRIHPFVHMAAAEEVMQGRRRAGFVTARVGRDSFYRSAM